LAAVTSRPAPFDPSNENRATVQPVNVQDRGFPRLRACRHRYLRYLACIDVGSQVEDLFLGSIDHFQL
jgi:hypothetical protein